MFVETADNNYILARTAFFNGLDLDFFWLSAHALEKYFKAILLLNGRNVKNFGHSLPELHAEVKKLHPQLNFGELADPKIDGLFWMPTTFEDFIVRMNDFGNPNNRYLTYGYCVMLDDLFKVDQVTWSVRRHCRPFKVTLSNETDTVEIDEIRFLQPSSPRWSLTGFSPIEQLLKRKNDDELKRMFLALNRPFAPESKHQISRYRSGSQNPPLAPYFEDISSPTTSHDTKETAAEVLQWALNHLQLNRDAQSIKDALSRYHQKRNSSTNP